NVIDVCPVGALTNKPFRFKARPWELIARESIGYHDALGTNLWLHTRRGEVLRAVPRDNEAINECWASDRDRYANHGLRAKDRAQKPMIRRAGELVEVSWAEALAFVADHLRDARGDVGALVAPLTSSEEGFLLGRLLRGIGSDHIDHRLRTLDFADAPVAAPFEMPVAAIDKAKAVLLVGCNPRHEVPLIAQRLRKAVRAGAKVHAINPVDFDLNFELAGKSIVTPAAMLDALLGLAKAANDAGHLPESSTLAQSIAGLNAGANAQALLKLLADASESVIVLGETALNHPNASSLRAAARFIGKVTHSAVNEIPGGANAIGLARAGAQPRQGGRDAGALLANPPKHLVVYHTGSQDTSAPAAFDRARTEAQFCVYVGAYACNGVQRTAHAVLPIGLPPEIDGSYTNLDGTTQVLAAAAKLPGDARPGWKVLRALGAALSVPGFEFTEIGEVRAQMAADGASQATATNALRPRVEPAHGRLVRIATTAIYAADAVVRRSPPLQAHPLARSACVTLHPEDALALGIGAGAIARVSGVELPVELSTRVPRGGAWIEAGLKGSSHLPPHGASLDITKA
ncbi:MAG: molybdopterin-dependent oxidoreductase, partial [Dokdonella sp.]|uniref:molybdopterin-dependent oxidoreductase n=1 Tax=Dokdonella sp. TaxID=2291710 RepID=UPI003F8071CB